jgi:hypothetical protein
MRINLSRMLLFCVVFIVVVVVNCQYNYNRNHKQCNTITDRSGLGLKTGPGIHHISARPTVN